MGNRINAATWHFLHLLLTCLKRTFETRFVLVTKTHVKRLRRFVYNVFVPVTLILLPKQVFNKCTARICLLWEFPTVSHTPAHSRLTPYLQHIGINSLFKCYYNNHELRYYDMHIIDFLVSRVFWNFHWTSFNRYIIFVLFQKNVCEK